MPRPLRLDFPGGHFHVVARGVARQTIFHDDADRRCFLKILGTACERYGGAVHAFCLMGNHYHLVLESLHGRLSSLMRHVNGSYGRWFNRRRERVGHLFQGRFKASLIDSDSYLLEAVRYVELNPCRAAIVSDPASWAWGSFAYRLDSGHVPAWFDRSTALERFATDPTEAVVAYRRFIERGLSDARAGEALRAQSIIGPARFVAEQEPSPSEIVSIFETELFERFEIEENLLLNLDIDRFYRMINTARVLDPEVVAETLLSIRAALDEDVELLGNEALLNAQALRAALPEEQWETYFGDLAQPALAADSTRRKMTGSAGIKQNGRRTRVNLTLHCDAVRRPNKLKVTWDGREFNLDLLMRTGCERGPETMRTHAGVGLGRLDGIPGAVARWAFVDGSEPSVDDRVTLSIQAPDGTVVLDLDTAIDRGNLQAHDDGETAGLRWEMLLVLPVLAGCYRWSRRKGRV